MTERTYLTVKQWKMFDELFERVESTNWHDTRELALGLVKDRDLEQKFRQKNANITTILQVLNVIKNEQKKKEAE